MKIRIIKPLRGFPAGYKLKIKTDKYGVPLDRYWRDRFKDAPVDGCIEVIKEED